MELQLNSHAALPGLFAFSDVDPDVIAEEKRANCFADALPEIRTYTLAGQEWIEMADICAAQELSEGSKDVTPSVKAKQFKGFLYAVTSYCSGRNYEVNAWQLIPESLYSGITMNKVDWAKVHAEERYGYGYLGQRVKVDGKVMILAKPVNFLRALPTVAPISMEQAQAYDAQCRPMGWRPTCYGDSPKISWHTLAGHPVVIYEVDGKPSRGTLICNISGVIQDFHLSKAEEGMGFDTIHTPVDLPPATNELGFKTLGSRPKQTAAELQAQTCLF